MEAAVLYLNDSAMRFTIATKEATNNMNRKTATLFLISSVVLLGCRTFLFADPTSTPSHTPTPFPTNTPQPTSTPLPTTTPEPTITPVPTETPTPTATTYPLSEADVLVNIALQEQDLKAFFQQIDIPTEGFVDGSQMGIHLIEPYFTNWGATIPSNLINELSIAYATNREFENREPTFIAAHNNTILVFPNPDEAHKFFLEDTQSMAAGLKLKNMPTIGDESVAFSGWLNGTRAIGGVMWRYQEVYIFMSAQLNFEVAPESLILISQNIQDRLEQALE
jgi:hypothetical protein